jgi:hypothetical protein
VKKLALPLLLALAGCAPEDTATTGFCDAFVATLQVQDRMQQPASSFVQGDPVTFEMRVANTSDLEQTITVRDGCPQVSFEVRDGADQAVWSDLADAVCTQALVPVTYARNETKTFVVEWDQRSDAAAQVPTGNYTVRALDRTDCSDSLTQSASFGIQ